MKRCDKCGRRVSGRGSGWRTMKLLADGSDDVGRMAQLCAACSNALLNWISPGWGRTHREGLGEGPIRADFEHDPEFTEPEEAWEAG